jgi:hypothetical protein
MQVQIHVNWPSCGRQWLPVVACGRQRAISGRPKSVSGRHRSSVKTASLSSNSFSFIGLQFKVKIKMPQKSKKANGKWQKYGIALR